MEYYIFKILVIIARFIIGDINKHGASVAINKIDSGFDSFVSNY